LLQDPDGRGRQLSDRDHHRVDGLHRGSVHAVRGRHRKLLRLEDELEGRLLRLPDARCERHEQVELREHHRMAVPDG
jgi:hypothetical protein